MNMRRTAGGVLLVPSPPLLITLSITIISVSADQFQATSRSAVGLEHVLGAAESTSAAVHDESQLAEYLMLILTVCSPD